MTFDRQRNRRLPGHRAKLERVTVFVQRRQNFQQRFLRPTFARMKVVNGQRDFHAGTTFCVVRAKSFSNKEMYRCATIGQS